jgi:ADP-heptose:LPS heptosyltransferase
MTIKRCIRNTYMIARSLALKCALRHKQVTRIDPSGVHSILVIRLDRIGDLVVSIPAIKALKQVFPSSRITALLARSTADLARLVPEIDEVIVYGGFFPALAQLRERKFSLVVDLLMDYPLKTAALAFFAGGMITCGFDIESRGRFFIAAFRPSAAPKQMSKDLSDMVSFLAALAGKGGMRADRDPVLALTESAREFSGQFLREKGIKDGDVVIGIAPGAKFPSQRWKEESFALLADRIAAKFSATIVIIAAGQEEAIVAKVVSSMKNKPAVALGVPLDKLGGVISRFRLLVANNSGPLHMAAALGVATVSTMGPTVPGVWRPHGDRHIVIRKDLACSPCNRAFCRSHECMEGISVEEMEQAVDVLMAKT